MSGPPWVATVDDAKVPEGRPVAVYPKGLAVLLIRREDELFADRQQVRAHGVPARGGQARGLHADVSVPRLALRHPRRRVPRRARSSQCRPTRSRSTTARSSCGSRRRDMADEVFLYALSTCPWCRKAKQWFTDTGVPFEFVDVDLLPRRRAGRGRREGARAQRRPALSGRRDQRRGRRRLQHGPLPRTAQVGGADDDGRRDPQGRPSLPVREGRRPAGLQVHARTRSSPTSCSSRRSSSSRTTGRRTAPARGAAAPAPRTCRSCARASPSTASTSTR